MVTELAAALRLPERTVEALVADSTTLFPRLPVTVAALQEGRVSWRHAQVMTDQIGFLPEEAIPAYEDALIPFAEVLTVAKFERKARVLRERMHPESIDDRHQKACRSREVSLSPGMDGMAWLTAHLPAVTAHAIFARVSDIATAHQGAGEDRTVTQLRADAFADLLLDGTTPTTRDHGDALDGSGGDPGDGAPGTPDRGMRDGRKRLTDRGIRPTVLITVPVLSLLGHSTEPATLDGYGPIDMDTASRLTAEAPSLIRILTHPETGTVLSVGRDRYTIPNQLRTWLRTRDGTCRFPCCSRPARYCDMDHTRDWQHGGTTDHQNLSHLCPGHHHVKHMTDWQPKQHPDGTIDWTSPTGHTYTTHPDTIIRAS